MKTMLNELLNAATIAHNMCDYQNAIIFYEKALAIDSNLPQVYIKIGNICLELNALHDAILYYQQAIELDKDNSYIAYSNIGIVFQKSNQIQEAKQYHEKALEINPNYTIALYNLSLIYLLDKNYIKGFDYYRFRYSKELRVGKKDVIAYLPTLLTKEIDISEKTIYINHEQGIGDTIQTVRFLHIFAKKAKTILSYVPTSLNKLFAYNYPEIEFILPDNNIIFDYNFPMFEAPYLLGISYEKIQDNEKYLSVKKSDSKTFKSKYITNNNKIKICINYKGSISSNSSIDLSILINSLNKLDRKIFELYSVQYDRTDEENQLLEDNNIINLGQHINDFYDTAIILENMDIIISIDTSVLHLAGAMGKKSFALLNFVPDWRWGLEDSSTNWYKHIELIRQSSLNDWDSVLEKLIAKLEFNS